MTTDKIMVSTTALNSIAKVLKAIDHRIVETSRPNGGCGYTNIVVESELDYAERNVAWLAEHRDGLVDMKGLGYWAGRVETLRARR